MLRAPRSNPSAICRTLPRLSSTAARCRRFELSEQFSFACRLVIGIARSASDPDRSAELGHCSTPQAKPAFVVGPSLASLGSSFLAIRPSVRLTEYTPCSASALLSVMTQALLHEFQDATIFRCTHFRWPRWPSDNLYMNEMGIGGWGGQCHDQSFHVQQYIMYYHNDHLAWDRKADSPFVIIAESSATLVQHILAGCHPCRKQP